MEKTAKEEIKKFIGSQVRGVLEGRQSYSVQDTKNGIDELRATLEKACGLRTAQVLQLSEDVTRYLKQYLADVGMHRQAKNLARKQNSLRTELHRAEGRILAYYLTKALSYTTGYLGSIWRILFFTFVIWLFFTIGFYAHAAFSGEASLIINGEPAPLHLYPYFSLVTLVTLGFGDIAPNSTVAWFPAYWAAIESVCGLILFGFAVSVFVNAAGPHATARHSRWFDDFEKAFVSENEYPAHIYYHPEPLLEKQEKQIA